MHKADITTRGVAGFIDLLLVMGLSRLPDVIGFMSATGYILIRDGLFSGRSLGKKLIGLRVVSSADPGRTAGYRESIIRNVTLAAAYLLFLIPFAGWILGPLALSAEVLAAVGDERGMRIGDLLAGTWIVQEARAAAVHEPAAESKADAPLEANSGEPKD